MEDVGLAQYRAAFLRTTTAAVGGAAVVVDESGIVGSPGTPSRSGRLLITDDRACTVLQNLGELRAHAVAVEKTARNCRRYMRSLGSFKEEPATAMFAEDVSRIAEAELPAGLKLRPVALDGDRAGAVSLENAAAAAKKADPDLAHLSLSELTAYLREIPAADFTVAVDEQGSIRGTAGSNVFGSDAVVFFVTTDVPWRGRGVGTAVTRAAIRSAEQRGARQLSLFATPAAERIYRRLGLQAVAELTLFSPLG